MNSKDTTKWKGKTIEQMQRVHVCTRASRWKNCLSCDGRSHSIGRCCYCFICLFIAIFAMCSEFVLYKRTEKKHTDFFAVFRRNGMRENAGHWTWAFAKQYKHKCGLLGIIQAFAHSHHRRYTDTTRYINICATYKNEMVKTIYYYIVDIRLTLLSLTHT